MGIICKSFKTLSNKKTLNQTLLYAWATVVATSGQLNSGKNAMTFLRPGTNLTDSQIQELKGKNWDVRYADEITPKSDLPTSSGKAGVPQKD